MTATVGTRSDPRPRVEAPLTLEEPAPRVLGWFDQLGLWGNLGISLLGPVGAIYVLQPVGFPPLSLVAAGIVTTYLLIQLLREPLPSLTHGSWAGFWPAADVLIAVAVSWVPLASDYTRHAKSPSSAFGSAMVGYTVTQTACYALGLV